MQKSDMQFLHIRETQGANMVEYSQIECHDCYGIFPGNVMRRKSISKAVGRSVRDYNPFDQDSMRSALQSATTHFDYSEIMLCPNCRAKRRLKTLLKTVLFISALGAAAYWYSTRSTQLDSDYDLETPSEGYAEASTIEDGNVGESSLASSLMDDDTPARIDDAIIDPMADASVLSDSAVADDSEQESQIEESQSEASRPATPINGGADWVTSNDYPSRALKQQRQGTTGVRLTVDKKGGVSDCEVTRSSGLSDLDKTACKKLLERGRFKPATDAQGQPVASVYTNTVNWSLPEGYEPEKKDLGREVGDFLDTITR